MSAKYIYSICLALSMVVTSCIHAVEVSLSLPHAIHQDHGGKSLPAVVVGQSFEVEVKVSSGNRDTGEVELEGANNLSLQRSGQSTSITVVNGTFSSDKTYTYNVIASTKGMFTLGPARVKQNGATVSSTPLTFLVVDKPMQKKHNARNVVSSNDQDEDAGEEVKALLMPSKRRVVQGQAFEAVLKILTRGGVVDIALDNVQFPGFLIKESGKGVNKREVIDKKTYFVHEKKFLVTAAQAGMQEIGPVTLIYTVQEHRKSKPRRGGGALDLFDSFFNMPRVVQKRAHSDKVIIAVEDLPDFKGRVDGVGSFSSFEAKVNQQTVKASEPITLQLILTGHGNFERIPDPKLSLPKDVRSYKSKTYITGTSSADITQGKKVYEFVVQPKRAGELVIPPQEFTFYNADTENYQTLKTNELRIAVEAVEHDDRQGASASTPNDGTGRKQENEKGAQETTGKQFKKDIHFIEESASASNKSAPGLPLWLFLLLLMLPLALLVWGFFSTSSFLSSSAWHLKRERRKKLANFEKQLSKLEVEKNSAGLYQLFLGFLAIKYNVDLSSINEQIITELLAKQSIDEDKIHAFLEFLNECAGLSFASQNVDESQHQKLIKNARYWFLMLNK